MKIFTRDFWIFNDYQDEILRIKTNEAEVNEELKALGKEPMYEHYRKDPEKNWHNRLFYFGLFLEAIAIIYYIGFKIKDESNRNLIAISDTWQITVYLFTLVSLLIHQLFIKNTFKDINKITINHWHCNKDSLFPNNLMFSTGELTLRSLFFLLFTVIAGEIPYLLMITEKIISSDSVKKQTIFPMLSEWLNRMPNLSQNLSNIFIIACFLISCVVLSWDILILTAQYISKRATPPNEEWDNSGIKKVLVFTVTGILSWLMWGSLLYFVISKDPNIIKSYLFSFAILFTGRIVLRIVGIDIENFKIYIKANPFNGEY